MYFSQTCLDRNPEAFKPKIGKGKEGESDRRHSKGCNCKRSGCLKNYCECYEVGPQELLSVTEVLKKTVVYINLLLLFHRKGEDHVLVHL